ncbi:alpha/beta hydrolase [Grimontia marina]|uniref:Alpha/beta hydrolase family protein n=1 Tax=Grimontia marina TaxID=646534 RepID=A0A128FJC5_9GAMM|nr:alpha/beta fold hydrolase [Grimontia marina]CZF86907.1 Alpha/beta hydrolase family protein [Grimontia marina]
MPIFKLIAVVLLGFFTNTVLANESTREVTISEGTIKGTHLQPESPQHDTVVLIISGSGPTDRDGNNPAMTNNSLKFLAEELSHLGISSLRYDKRGVGESATVDESELTFDTYINDAVNWVNFLRNELNYKKVIVAGHSEGSLIGMLVSQRADVDKFISIAGAGSRVDHVIREQLKQHPKTVQDESDRILKILLQGKLVEDVPDFLEPLFRLSVQPYMISWLNYDPTTEISKLEIPTLILQGTTDLQVNLKEAQKLKLASKNAHTVVINDMNHILKTAPMDKAANFGTYNDPTLPVSKELVESISSFINDTE